MILPINIIEETVRQAKNERVCVCGGMVLFFPNECSLSRRTTNHHHHHHQHQHQHHVTYNDGNTSIDLF